MADLSRLSFNQFTADQWSLAEAVDGCARAGFSWIGLWRHKVDEVGAEKAARLVSEAGLRVSSLCRGGFFPAETEGKRRQALDDNRRAVDEAAALGTDVLVLVCGPVVGRDLDASRRMVQDGIAELLPYAASRGVRLGIEPLHPMMAAERSVVVTLAQANRMAAAFPPEHVGVVVDVYHVWWDPEVYTEIAGASGRILGFHVSDWAVPTTDLLAGRAMMGDGVIELERLRRAVDDAGYRGPIEVEVLNRSLWQRPGDDVCELVKRRFLEHV